MACSLANWGFLAYLFFSCLIAFAEVRALSGLGDGRDAVNDYVTFEVYVKISSFL